MDIYNGIRSLPKTCEIAVILCARQFGKSFLGALLAIEDCLRYDDRCILVMGPTLKQATDIVAPRIREIMRDAPKGLIRRSKAESKWYIGKSELVIGGFDLNSTSQRGKTVQNIYIEEIVDSNPDNYNEAMKSDLGPALTHSDGGKMIFLTTPPKIPDHPFILDTMAQARLNSSLYTYTIHDNKVLTPQQVEACIRRCGGVNTVEFRREYLCEIVRDASILVIPDFDEVKNVQDHPIPPKGFYQTTIDFGGVRDYTCAVLHMYDYYAKRLIFVDERVFPPNTPTNIIVDEIRRMEGGREIAARHADAPGQITIDLMTAHNFEVMMPPKSDWIANVNSLSIGFANGEVVIMPHCKFLIESARSGTFNRNRTDFERTLSLGHCDGIAAMMYAKRVQRYDNPNQSISLESYGYFVKNAEAEKATLDMLATKVFAKPKKFGAFNK